MTHILIVAGLQAQAFDKIRAISANRLAPGGHLVLAPMSYRYSKQYAYHLIGKAHECAMEIKEDDPLSVQLLYVDYGDDTTTAFLDHFFPFSMPHAIAPPNLFGATPKQLREILNQLSEEVLAASLSLRQRSRQFSEFTHIANMTPLLLPPGNFQSRQLDALLRMLFSEISKSDDIKTLVRERVHEFLANNPKRVPPTEGYGHSQHCFCDGHLYFQSPGRHRHGFFRRDTPGHDATCLLNARSRIGGTYHHNFHYDCVPVRGGLKGSYDNCHGAASAPKPTHVNIAPNDFIG